MGEPAIYCAPWRARQQGGELGPEYGPTPATYARQQARFKMWTWRPGSSGELPDLDRMRAWMRPGPDGELRRDVPDRERQVYLAVYEQGVSVRGAASVLGVSRDTVRVYLRRLRRRAEQNGLDGDVEECNE